MAVSPLLKALISVFKWALIVLMHVLDEDVQADHDHQKARARAAQQQSASTAVSKKTTVNDLTQGIVNYKYLGLDFVKAEGDRLR
jgi:hypothetical protein